MSANSDRERYEATFEWQRARLQLQAILPHPDVARRVEDVLWIMAQDLNPDDNPLELLQACVKMAAVGLPAAKFLILLREGLIAGIKAHQLATVVARVVAIGGI